jgi:Transposase, Mutator family
LLSGHADKLTDNDRARLVRHGHLPEREIMTGIGAVAVGCPRVRDRVGEGRIRFSSAVLPPYARRSKSLEVLIPILYLKGVSTGDFEEALVALLGKDAGGFSASTVARLKDAWSEEHARWSKRDLSAKRYVYFWVDGIHVQARLEDAAQTRGNPAGAAIVDLQVRLGRLGRLTVSALQRFGFSENAPITVFVKRLRCSKCGSGSVAARRTRSEVVSASSKRRAGSR